MAHYSNKTCERCGYKTHRTFDVDYIGYYGICADCVLNAIMKENCGEDTDELLNLIDDIVVADESAEV